MTLAREADYARSIYWMTSITVESMDRDALIAALRSRNVDTRPVFPAISPVSLLAPPADAAARPPSGSASTAINLPSGVRLRRDEVRYVAAQIREVVAGKVLVGI